MIEFFLQDIVLKIIKFTKSCNRRKKEASPHNGGEYMAENLIYQATIETDNLSKIYIGLSVKQLKNAYQHIIQQ